MTTALVIGAGPAGLMAAQVMAEAGVSVTIADAMPSFGRKFLMAGKSGLNLTKDEEKDVFLDRYGTIAPALATALRGFGPVEVMAWAEDLEQAIFTGTSGRVFPEAMKASPLLRAWLGKLTALGVTARTRLRWQENSYPAVFDGPNGVETIPADIIILALGGASWARLGSDGAWAEGRIDVAPFQPANCGFGMNWTDFMQPFFGEPVKATSFSAGPLTSRGEWIVTANGIEGGGIYDVSAAVRDGATLTLDLTPDIPIEALRRRIVGQRSKSTLSQVLRKGIGLKPLKVALFQEFSRNSSLSDPNGVAHAIKALRIRHSGPLPINQAISTSGGLRFDALTPELMLKSQPGIFAAGEMLDWEAPTGGYLITACLATGRHAGISALRYVNNS